jgi:hypothetical protein
MPTISEALAGSGTSSSQLASLLEGGMRQLSLNQVIQFNLYKRYVFPLDGMNYFIKVLPGSANATVSAVPGIANSILNNNESIQVVPGNVDDIIGGYIVNPLNAVDQDIAQVEDLIISLTADRTDKFYLEPGDIFNFPAAPKDGVWVTGATAGHKFTVVIELAVSTIGYLPLTINASGSLHVAIETEQEEDTSIDINTAVFNTEMRIKPFNEIGLDFVYIGVYNNIRFSFSTQQNFYEAANLHHYVGEAIYPINSSLIIDDPLSWEPELIVSNSLPIWLGMPSYVPPYPGFRCSIPLYPSYLVPENLDSPYGSVHIEETISLASFPFFDRNNNQDQLARDTIVITLYGVSNDVAGTFLAFVQQYSADWGKIGMASTPVISDQKRIQSELNIISMKKDIKYEVNYHQSVVRNEARQFILGAKVQFVPAWLFQ